MHVPDGLLDAPVCLGAAAVSAGAVGYSLRRLNRSLADRTVPLTGMMAALVFAGQMVNFPIGLLGVPAVSGHLMGGVLAAAVVGPWAGCVAVTLVLIVQCLMFADGGLLALGVNVLNMAVVGSLGGYAVLASVRRWFGEAHFAAGTLVGAVLAAWLSVLAASALFCLELWLSLPGGEYNLGAIFTMMVTFHAAIGVGEAVITGGVLGFVLARRPDLLPRPAEPTALARAGWTAVVGVVAALAVAAFLAPFASEHPDGLEAVAARTLADVPTESHALLLSDYAFPLPLAGWESAPVWQKVSVALAGLLGTAAVFVTAWLLVRSVRPRRALIESAHAE